MTHHLFHLEKLTGMKTNFITEIYDGRCLHLSCLYMYTIQIYLGYLAQFFRIILVINMQRVNRETAWIVTLG